MIGPLTDPAAHGGDAADAFHVVCPSLPGYGFSDKPAEPAGASRRIARAWAELMARLGYDRYGAQGGDWGAAVTTTIGRQDPEHSPASTSTWSGPAARRRPGRPDRGRAAALASLAELPALGHRATRSSSRPGRRRSATGWSTRPPRSAAWIVEKFWAWTDCDGHPENVLTRDELLDNVMLYWLPATGASSARLYWESFTDFGSDPVDGADRVLDLPEGDLPAVAALGRARFTDIRHWNELDRGGHFAAFEQPDSFVDEVRAFFRLVR